MPVIRDGTVEIQAAIRAARRIERVELVLAKRRTKLQSMRPKRLRHSTERRKRVSDIHLVSVCVRANVVVAICR